MPINAHFDLIAPLYDRLIRPPDPEQLKELLNLPASGWMLDAAGGTGRVASLLCPLIDHLVVCDLSLPMLKEARQKGDIIPSMARVERLPFADGQFDRILMVDAFHHLSDQPGALRELTRLLAPGGHLVIEEPDIRQAPVWLIALGETLMLMGSHFRRPEWISARMLENGLTVSLISRDSTFWMVGIK